MSQVLINTTMPGSLEDHPSAQPDDEPTDRSTCPAAPDRGAWRRAVLPTFAVWLACNIAHLAVNALAWHARGARAPGGWHMFDAWLKWDTVHYLHIAERGYLDLPGLPAFYPLYPMLIRVSDVVLPQGPLFAALFVANVAAFAGLLVLHRLAQYEFGAQVAHRAVYYLAVFPMGFFLFAGYNESLFIVLSVGALYAARRGHWWLAGVLGAFSSATRLFGILLLVPFALEYLRQRDWQLRRIRPDVLAFGLVPAGLAAYALYCWRVLGDPLAFSKAQGEWKRTYTLPGQAWLDALGNLDAHPLLHVQTVGALLEVGAPVLAIVLLGLCVVGPWRFRRDQSYLVVYGAMVLLLLACTHVGVGRATQSAPRYVLEVVPAFLVLARIGAHQVVDRLYVTLGVSLQALYLVVFLIGKAFVA